jgi:hypothetical protein
MTSRPASSQSPANRFLQRACSNILVGAQDLAVTTEQHARADADQAEDRGDGEAAAAVREGAKA